ncbi:MAG: flippase-like domain-containing protein [Firmicutes bacterium]|nr:flippase-like domain-containing protein [Bacillota bacterium]
MATENGGFNLRDLAKKLAISMLIGIAVLVGLGFFMTDYRVSEVLHFFSVKVLFIVVLICLANYLLRFLKWHFFLWRLGIEIDIKESLLIFLSGLALSPTPARSGELIKIYWLNRYNQTAASISGPVVVAEWITDSISAVILAGVGVNAFEYGAEVLVLVGLMLMLLILVIENEKLAYRILWLLERVRIFRRFSARLTYVYQTAAQLMGFKNLAISTLISLGSWSLEVLALVYLMQSINAPISFSQAAFVFCFATTVGIITMVPGGLAVVEGGMVGLLLLLSVPRSEAVLGTIVIRSGTLWLGVLMGIVCLGVLLNRYFGWGVCKQKRDVQPRDERMEG